MTQPTPAEQPARHTVAAEQLLNLADRAERHGGLTADEAGRLRAGVAHHCARADALAAHLKYVLNYDGPGHCHLIPGRWDKDNSPCGHCARLAAARAVLDEHQEQQPTT